MTFLALFSVLLSFGACTHLQKLDFIDFYQINVVNVRQYEAPHEVTLLAKIQKNLQQRKFQDSLLQSRLFLKQYPHSIYFLWAKMMEGQSLEGNEMFEEALAVYSFIVQTTAGNFKASSIQIQAYALYHRARTLSRTGNEQKALASFLDAYEKRDLLPALIGQVELPLEIARSYSVLKLPDPAEKYEKISVAGLERYLKESLIEPEKKASILLQLGWRESLKETSFQEFSFIRSEHQKNLYLLATIQLEIEPYASLALNNLTRTMANYQKPLSVKPPQDIEARNTFRADRQKYALELAEVYREMELRMSPASLRGGKENEFAEFFNSYKTALFDLFREVQIANDLTSESAKRNSLRREFKSNRFMPEIKNRLPLPTKVQPKIESIPSVDPQL